MFIANKNVLLFFGGKFVQKEKRVQVSDVLVLLKKIHELAAAFQLLRLLDWSSIK